MEISTLIALALMIAAAHFYQENQTLRARLKGERVRTGEHESRAFYYEGLAKSERARGDRFAADLEDRDLIISERDEELASLNNLCRDQTRAILTLEKEKCHALRAAALYRLEGLLLRRTLNETTRVQIPVNVPEEEVAAV